VTRGRKACRMGQHCDPSSFAEALYCLVQHSDLEPTEIAARVGKRVGYLLDASNPDREDTKFQAELLIAVMHVTGNLAPLEYLCRAFGGVFVPVPAGPASDEALLCAFAKVVAEVGEDGAALTAKLADGCVLADGRAKLMKEINETVAELVRFRALVESRGGLR